MRETMRQLVHVSGLAFILLALFVDRLVVSAYFFMVAFSLLAYSFLFRRERNSLLKTIQRLETSFKRLIDGFERGTTRTPFIGAFWFYFSCGLALVVFPLGIAIVSCAVLALADCLSTLIGIRLGRHRIIGKKTLEGSLVFFFTALAVIHLFTGTLLMMEWWFVVPAALVATLSELVPDMQLFRKLREREMLDDNFTIVFITGLFLFLASSII